MLLTLDTNVLYQALYSNVGASHFILKKIRSRELQIALSVSVFTEYEEVLTRSESLSNFNLKKTDIEKFLRFIAYIGKVYETHFLFRPNLMDESDNKFLELAITSQSNYLITNNKKDFQNAELRFENLKIATPGEFVKRWRQQHG